MFSYPITSGVTDRCITGDDPFLTEKCLYRFDREFRFLVIWKHRKLVRNWFLMNIIISKNLYVMLCESFSHEGKTQLYLVHSSMNAIMYLAVFTAWTGPGPKKQRE